MRPAPRSVRRLLQALVAVAIVVIPTYAGGTDSGKNRPQPAAKPAPAASAGASAPADPIAQWGPLGFHATWVHPYDGAVKARVKQPAATKKPPAARK